MCHTSGYKFCYTCVTSGRITRVVFSLDDWSHWLTEVLNPLRWHILSHQYFSVIGLEFLNSDKLLLEIVISKCWMDWAIVQGVEWARAHRLQLGVWSYRVASVDIASGVHHSINMAPILFLSCLPNSLVVIVVSVVVACWLDSDNFTWYKLFSWFHLLAHWFCST